MLKKKNNFNGRFLTLSAIIFIILSTILIYYNESQKINLFQNVDADSIDILLIHNLDGDYDNVTEKKQISEIISYLHSLKIKSTNQNVSNETPNVTIGFKCKNGCSKTIRIYDGNIAFIYPEEEYPDKYIVYGYNSQQLKAICNELNMESR